MNLYSLNRTVTLAALLLLLFSCSEKRKESAIIEIVFNQHEEVTGEIMQFYQQEKRVLKGIYQWENHWLLCVDASESKQIQSKIEKHFPRTIQKNYDKPFYQFNRQEHCNQKSAAEWTSVIMTANLVEDVDMQEEYMKYHQTQFENWPEVSQGFCNADFQQLLLFRNGRQLMLVISIPKGEDLDELNPLTTENNPRVDEWNSIMSKYQEGVENAPEGATWIEFQQIR